MAQSKQYMIQMWLFYHLSDFLGSFPCDSHVVAVHGENLYTVEPNRVQIRTPQVCALTLQCAIICSYSHMDE